MNYFQIKKMLQLHRQTITIAVMFGMMVLLMPIGVSAANTYPDIENHWSKAIIQSWVDKGYVSGYADETFKPDKHITRAEFMALVNNAFNFTNTASIDHLDVSPEAWYAVAVSRAKAAGYINGYPDGTMKPDHLISREEAASIIMRLKSLAPDEAAVHEFTDVLDITWSKAAVGAVANAEIMVGYPDGSFLPRKNITRAEAVAALDKALGSSAGTLVPINISTISEINTPIKGAAPVSTLEAGPQFTAAISWQPTDTVFAASTVYTAIIDITPKAGYTLKGVPANFFTIAGAAATNPADSGVVTAVFPRTGASSTGGSRGSTSPLSIASISDISIVAGLNTAVAVVTTPANAALSAVCSDINVANVSVVGHDLTISGVAAGTATVTVTASKSGYKNATGTFLITVIPRELTGIAVSTPPAKLSYVEGQNLDLSGLSATLSYNDQSIEEVLAADFAAQGITVNPTEGTVLTVADHNGRAMVLTYNGQTASSENLSVVPREVASITVKSPPFITTYYAGQSLNLTGLEVTLSYNDESTADAALTDFAAYGISVSPIGGTTLAITDAEVAISVNGKTTQQPIFVNPIILIADSTDNDVDHDIDIAFAAGASYADAITLVSFNGVELTANIDYTVSSDKVTLKPSSGNLALRTPATAAIVIKAVGYGNASVMQTIMAGGYNSIAVTTTPVLPTTNGEFFATQPVLTIYDRYGNICADGRSSTASVYATHINGVPGQWQMYGTLRINAVAGVAAYTDLQCWASYPGTGHILFELEETPYTAYSSFTLPDIDILGFKPIADVDAGTAGYSYYEDVAAVQAVLPTSVQTKSFSILEDYYVDVPVTEWDDADTYEPAEAGSYTFTAILGTFPSGYANLNGYTVSVEVVVSAPADLTGYEAAIAAVDEEEYTSASWARYQAVVDANVVTIHNAQTEVDAATANILAAQADLVARSAMGGSVAITGSAKFGETLQADITGITYIPATADDVLSYQWQRDGEHITGATAAAYTLIAADIGEVISVTVSADGEHAKGSLTSAPTSPVDKADGPAAPEPPKAETITTTTITLAANPLLEFSINGGAKWQYNEEFAELIPSTAYTILARVKESSTHKASAPSEGSLITTPDPSLMSGFVIIAGVEKFGQELSVDTSGINFNLPTSANVFSYQWYRGDDPINGAIDSSYTLTEADIGQTITATVSADGLNAVGSITSAATGVIAKADGPAALGQDIKATYPIETTIIDLKNLASKAAGLEAAIAIDGINFEPYVDLSVSSSGEARISGLTDVSASSVVRIRVKETATVLAGEDKEITVIEAGVGDRGPTGGFIFYDKGSYSDGWRYIEAAGVNVGSSIYCDVNFMPTGGYDTAIGSGQSNTNDIMSRTTVSAAKLCDDWSWGGKDDWFLPSKDELAAMYSELHQHGVGGFDNYWYWSSSEYVTASGTIRPDLAWVILFDNGSASAYQKTVYPWRVRAARYL